MGVHEDFAAEELAVIAELEKRRPIIYGKRTVEIHYEAGKRVRASVQEQREIVEKFRRDK